MLKNILLFIFCIFFVSLYGQREKCVKCEQMFSPKSGGSGRSNPFIGATFTTLGVQNFSVIRSKKHFAKSYANLFTLNLGLAHEIKKRFAFGYAFSMSVGNMADSDDRFSGGFTSNISYYFQRSYQGLGVGVSVNAYQNLILIPSLNLHYSLSNRKVINNYTFGVMYLNKQMIFQLGAKTGVQVWK